MTGLARAPGKLVLSGAYSVLWGAPALVTAVDCFALADRDWPALHVAEEVLAAVELGLCPRPCFVDASELRVDEGGGKSRKLGLGSSAAILLATLAAFRGVPTTTLARDDLFRGALAAHRKAQGGGSGIDVAASTFGGTLAFRVVDLEPVVQPVTLPPGLEIAVFAAASSSITAGFVARVKRLAAEQPDLFAPLLAAAKAGAERALEAPDAARWVLALAAQRDALRELGDHAGVGIVTPAVQELAEHARRHGAFFGPSGAGGGDVAFYAADAPPPPSFIEAAAARAYSMLRCTVGAPGVVGVAR